MSGFAEVSHPYKIYLHSKGMAKLCKNIKNKLSTENISTGSSGGGVQSLPELWEKRGIYYPNAILILKMAPEATEQ